VTGSVAHVIDMESSKVLGSGLSANEAWGVVARRLRSEQSKLKSQEARNGDSVPGKKVSRQR